VPSLSPFHATAGWEVQSYEINGNDFDRYRGKIPWLALPSEDRDKKKELSAKFGVSGIPTLVILNSGGDLITKNGRNVVNSKAYIEEFLWLSFPWYESLTTWKLINTIIYQIRPFLDVCPTCETRIRDNVVREWIAIFIYEALWQKFVVP